MTTTYVKSGVNIAAGESLVKSIKKMVHSTYTKGVMGEIGSFGAFFDARFPGYKHPVLVSSVDGVGTKLMIAQQMGRHGTVGEDLVNHCVNDILVCGAKPLYFMDYFATGKLSPHVATEVMSGFVRACKTNNCSLIGGETAEMPGFYKEDEYDIAGTIVGVVEKKNIIDGRKIKKGDVLLGLPSTGLHTNGYSLARSVLFPRYELDDYLDILGARLGEVLLTVHRSYYEVLSDLMRKFELRGLAHITGGGIEGNTRRIIPKGLNIHIDWKSWQQPSIFDLIHRVGDVPEEEMRRTFNLGVGLVAIVSRKVADKVIRHLEKKKEQVWVMGEVISRRR